MKKVPDINDLPKIARSGWPWSEASAQNVSKLWDVDEWPKMSIVTPSFNQAPYLEETIRSVLLQGYPNLEYIIIDGGSTDGSLEIIKKYEPWLAYWESGKDAGQSQAINKGFRKSSGEVMAWINSDDTYAPGVFFEVAKALNNDNTSWVAGITQKVNEVGEILSSDSKPEEKIEDWYIGGRYHQQSIFWKRNLWNIAGELNEHYNYSFDYDLWMRFIQIQPFATWIDKHIANFRIHSESKTRKDQLKFIAERKKIYKSYPLKKFSLQKRFLIITKRRERKSEIYIRLNGELSIGLILLKILWTTPWYFFRIKFLYWIKKRLEK